MGDEEYSADAIKVISHREAVRRRPGMYFGDVTAGLEPFVFELVANGLDQFLLGRATRVDVSLSGDRVVVSDDGPGLPFDEDGPDGGSLAMHFLTCVHHQATADGHAPHVHLLRSSGVGLAALSAVCSSFVCTSWRGGIRWRQEFCRGVPSGPLERVEDGSGRGTRIEAIPDAEIWTGSLAKSRASIRSGLFLAAHLVAGIRLGFDEERFFAPGGLADLVHVFEPPQPGMTAGPPAPFNFQERIGDLELSVAMLGRSEETRWRTWVNGVPSILHGSDRQGIEDALQNVNWRPAVVASHLIMHDPHFAGPTRDKLEVPSVVPRLREALRGPLKDYLAHNPVLKQKEPS